MKSQSILFVLIFLFVLFLSACDAEVVPAVPISSSPPCHLDAGASIPLLATNVVGEVILEWSASAGTIVPNQGPAVTFTAPKDYSGDVIIVLTTKRGEKSQSANMTCAIIPPTPTPTPQPTPTPEPTATPTPTITPSPTFPPTLQEIFPGVNGGEYFEYENNGGNVDSKFLPNPNCIHTGVYGLQLIFAMTGNGNGGWGVYWDKSNSKYFDASGFNAFTFWVKGAAGGEVFQVGIKDTNGKEVKVESIKLIVVTTDWVKVTATFSNFQGVNVASIQNVNFGFNSNHGTGSICLDDIAFENNP